MVAIFTGMIYIAEEGRAFVCHQQVLTRLDLPKVKPFYANNLCYFSSHLVDLGGVIN